MDDPTRIDGNHLSKIFLPRLNQYIWSASFAPERFYVQRVFVCAAVISQDEAVIHELLTTMPLWSTTQDNLDWQPDDERRSSGDVYQHLQAMSSSARDCPKPDHYLFKEVESSDATRSICSHSFRLSTLEICNADTPKGYHIGATALQKLPGFESKKDECDLWSKLFFEYLIKMDDESPGIIWKGRRVPTAVVWQVQLDIVDTRLGWRPRCGSKRRRYGALLQVPELPAPPERQHKGGLSPGQENCKSEYKGVRHRPERGPTGVWVAETRLPTAEEKKRNKVSFGDYKSDYEAARAIDAVFHYYHKGPYNFLDSPELLQTRPSLEGLEGEEKLKAVKKQAKWLAANAPPPSTSPPSSPIPTAESIASPGFSRSDSRESDESAMDGISLDYIDDLLEPFYEQRTHSNFEDEMSLIIDESYEASTPSSTETFVLSTTLYSQFDCFNMIDYSVDACASESTPQVFSSFECGR